MQEEIKKELFTILEKEDVKENELMANYTSFRVGGPAKLLLRIKDEESLAKVIRLLRAKKLPYFLLGNGSNLLVSDSGYNGVIIKLEGCFNQIKAEQEKIYFGASVLLSTAAKEAMEREVTGLEFASGIPGTIGGGTVMNAGAYGGELSQVITSVRAMNEAGEILELNQEQLEFGYRFSIFKKQPWIVLGVTVKAKNGNKEEIKSLMETYNCARREKQPLEYPSAGSTFKRPEGYFAGKLIMDAGLKGYSIGGAMVSDKHCGFIINKQNATASDIVELMKYVQKKVKDEFQVELEPEVIYLGE